MISKGRHFFGHPVVFNQRPKLDAKIEGGVAVNIYIFVLPDGFLLYVHVVLKEYRWAEQKDENSSTRWRQ